MVSRSPDPVITLLPALSLCRSLSPTSPRDPRSFPSSRVEKADATIKAFYSNLTPRFGEPRVHEVAKMKMAALVEEQGIADPCLFVAT